MSKKQSLIIGICLLAVLAGAFIYQNQPKKQPNLGASIFNLTRNIAPITTDTYDIGSSTDEYNNAYVKNITISGNCTGCGAGSNVDNLIYSPFGGTKYYTASSTASDNLSFYFNNGFISNASSTFSSTVNFAPASIATAALAASTISGVSLGSNLSSLSVTGSLSGTSYNGSAAVSNWAINTANSNTWSVPQYFSTASSTGAIEGGGQGGVTIYSMGSGVGTLGFNSLGYSAGVAGYGALFQLTPSTGAFNMFTESNVSAGAQHSHITTLSWDNTGLLTFPIGFVSQASSTVVGDFAISGGSLKCTGCVSNTNLSASTISGISLGSNLNAHTVSGTLSGSSYNGSSAISDWAINLGSSNTWTASTTFGNGLNVSGGLNLNGNTATSTLQNKVRICTDDKCTHGVYWITNVSTTTMVAF